MNSTQLQSTNSIPATSNGAIRHFAEALAIGKHWFVALLETIGLWQDAEENHNGRTYQYLIAGEAFDWLLLAERLCQAVESLLPKDEKEDLLFHGTLPLPVTKVEFKKLIGSTKYRQYLNYYYGITVEESLVLAVQDEVRKERQSLGFNHENNTAIETFRRIYGSTQSELLNQFRREQRHHQTRSISLTELKEFTYWLFKYRLKHCDRARVASDTKKAIKRLDNPGFAAKPAANKPFS